MAKRQNISTVKGFFGTNFFTIILVILGMGSIFAYDRMVLLAGAQSISSDSPTAIPACVNDTNGNLRVISSGNDCKNGEHKISLQSAISNLISDVEIVWNKPAGDRTTNFDAGVNATCPQGKTIIGGGSTEVVRQNVPLGTAISGNSGQTTSLVDTWSIIPWHYVDAPVVYAICAKVNK